MGAELTESAFNPLVQAPAVTYPLSRPVFLHGVLLFVLCLALSVDLVWIAMASAGDWLPRVGLMATMAVAGWCWWQGPLTVSGRLSWDGANWWWEAANAPHRGTIQVRLDTQSGMLVRFVIDTGAGGWLWLSQASDAGRWLALRRAIHADSHRHASTTAPARVPPS